MDKVNREVRYSAAAAQVISHQRYSAGGRYARRRGIVLVWVAIILMFLVLIVGLALDSARCFVVAEQLQNGADGAALAGARLIKIDHINARLWAQQIAAANYADGQTIALDLNLSNNPAGDIVIGWWDGKNRTFISVDPATQPANAMKVVARRTNQHHGAIPLMIGPLAGVNTTGIAQDAVALSLNGVGPGLIALAPMGIGLSVHGDIILDITRTTNDPSDGAIYVNSKDNNGFTAKGNVYVKAAELDVCGPDIRVTGASGQIVLDAPITYGAPYHPDPLGHVPEPTVWGPDQGTFWVDTGTHVLDPGYYPGGIHVEGDADVTLNPGIYVVDGEGLAVNGGFVHTPAGVTDGVMFFLTGTGVVNLGGNGTVGLNAPTTDPTYHDILFFQSRSNRNDSIIRGTNLLNGLDGTLYFPNNHIMLIGTEGTIGTQLVAWTIELGGDGTFNICYDGRFKKTIDVSCLIW